MNARGALSLFLLALLAQPVWAQEKDYSEVIKNLRDKDAQIRRSAAVVLGENGVKEAARPLIEALKDDNEAVRLVVAASLEKITHLNREFGLNYEIWKEWWESEGRAQFPEFTKKEEIEPLKRKMGDLERQVEKLGLENKMQNERTEKDLNNTKESMKTEMKDQKNEIRTLLVIGVVLGVLFVIIMIYFAGVGASRLKMWKETIKQAEFYVKETNEITRRTDKIIEELETKKADIMQFVTKTREDGQAEIERFCELLESNVEHRMREASEELRDKTEKEVAHTLAELKTQLEYDLKRLMAEAKQKGDQEFTEREDLFAKEVQVQTLYLEASFYTIEGKLQEALQHYNKLLRLKPNHAMAWLKKGNCLRELGRHDEALETYRRALEITPENPHVLYQMATTYARLRKKDKVIQHLSMTFQNDGEYKDEAINDPAFREYWSDPAFRKLTEV